MSKAIFWFGGLFFVSVPWAEEITGRTFTSADKAEGLATAACMMVFGIGLHVMHHP